MKKNSKKRAGIWLRISTNEQPASEALEAHRHRAYEYAESKDWHVVEEYRVCSSGKAVLNHPETQRMLEDIKSGHINVLIISKLSRLSRNLRELIEINDILQQHNAGFVSLGEEIDTTTSIGRFFFHMMGTMAQYEREAMEELETSKGERR